MAPKSALEVRRERAAQQAQQTPPVPQAQAEDVPLASPSPPPAPGSDVVDTSMTSDVDVSMTEPMKADSPLVTSRRVLSYASKDQCILQHDSVCCGVHDESIVVRGTCMLQVVRGAVLLGGARLTPCSPPHPIYAPETFPAAEILPVPYSADSEHRDILPHYDTVVRLQSIKCGIEQLARVCPLAGMDPFALHRAVPECTFTLESNASDTLCVPTEWRDVYDELGSLPSRVPMTLAVRGGKNTGKSTLARLLLHALLTNGEHRFVAFMELDVGQPEFGPPGMLSLHVFDAQRESGVFGPSWCTARVPVRAHFLGDVTPRNDPARYMAAVTDLMETYRQHFASYQSTQHVEALLHVSELMPHTSRASHTIPLIVNMHGWVKGLGLELVQHATAALCPTHVIDLGAMPLADTTHTITPFGDTLVGLGAMPARRLNAAESRTLSLLSYLHTTRLAQVGVHAHWDFACALVAQRPWIVDVHAGLGAGWATLDTGAHVDEALSLLAMNGAIAAIVQAPRPLPREESDNELDVWHVALRRGAVLSAVASPPALGLALVRSIDMERGEMHLLTPLDGQILKRAQDDTGLPLGLLQGALDLPFWGALDSDAYADIVQWRHDRPAPLLAGVPREQVPYLLWPSELLGMQNEGAEPLGARPRKVRRNLMRRRQMHPP